MNIPLAAIGLVIFKIVVAVIIWLVIASAIIAAVFVYATIDWRLVRRGIFR